MGYPYRLPRSYRYRRGTDKGPLIAVAAFVVLMGAAGSHSSAVRHGLTEAAAGIAAPVASGSESSFIRAVLADIGAPATQANVTSLASWFPHEFPSWPPAAANNPMASTMPEPGAGIYNSAGVRNYVSASQGEQATAATLDDGNFPGIAAALRSGRGLCGSSLAGEFLTWSGSGYSGVC